MLELDNAPRELDLPPEFTAALDTDTRDFLRHPVLQPQTAVRAANHASQDSRDTATPTRQSGRRIERPQERTMTVGPQGQAHHGKHTNTAATKLQSSHHPPRPATTSNRPLPRLRSRQPQQHTKTTATTAPAKTHHSKEGHDSQGDRSRQTTARKTTAKATPRRLLLQPHFRDLAWSGLVLAFRSGSGCGPCPESSVVSVHIATPSVSMSTLTTDGNAFRPANIAQSECAAAVLCREEDHERCREHPPTNTPMANAPPASSRVVRASSVLSVLRETIDTGGRRRPACRLLGGTKLRQCLAEHGLRLAPQAGCQ